jgi:hypothetical protein
MTRPYIVQEKDHIEKAVRRYILTHDLSADKEGVDDLVDTIYHTIRFNKNLKWKSDEVSLATTVDVLLDIYAIRSRIYRQIGYDKELPDPIKGLSYDSYDTASAVLYIKKDDQITATCRVIFDSEKGLPMDKHFKIDYLRDEGKRVTELSKLMIVHERRGLNQEFRLLTRGVYEVTLFNGMTTVISAMIEEHYGLYERFGGFGIEGRLSRYGVLPIAFIVTSWHIEEVSGFFKKLFLP